MLCLWIWHLRIWSFFLGSFGSCSCNDKGPLKTMMTYCSLSLLLLVSYVGSCDVHVFQQVMISIKVFPEVQMENFYRKLMGGIRFRYNILDLTKVLDQKNCRKWHVWLRYLLIVFFVSFVFCIFLPFTIFSSFLTYFPFLLSRYAILLVSYSLYP